MQCNESNFFFSGNSKNRSYLVLWRDLPYDDCTWEDPKLVEKNEALVEDFKKQVDAYWRQRKERLEHKRDIRPPKKSLVSSYFGMTLTPFNFVLALVFYCNYEYLYIYNNCQNIK